jgi:cation diffusion facilitator CzcD-associated flavoprotein CzcO
MDTTTTVIIGAGHAGLAMSSRLTDRSIDHVVLERGEVANPWRTDRWDSLRLLTPNWQSHLPGMGYTAATHGFAETIDVPGAPSVAALHEEYIAKGGRFFACPVCVKVRGLQDSTWVANTQVAGMPSVLEYTTGGALVFNY